MHTHTDPAVWFAADNPTILTALELLEAANG